MNVEDYFMDPLEAKKLRRMAKQQGLQAVVDEEGYVKVPVSESAAEPVTRPPAARRDSSSSNSTVGANAAAATDPAADQQKQEGQNDSGGSSSGSSRSKLFSKSQLQPAAPGSGGMAPALPIVRPSSSSSRSEQDSSRSRPLDTPPWANKGRGRPGSSSYGNDRGGSSSSAAFFSSKSWEDLRATPELIAALKLVGVEKPSHIQAEAFKALSPKSGLRHVALADQAGSGKTLAYLLPLLQQLKQKETAAGGPVTQANSPSIVIMAPTTGGWWDQGGGFRVLG
jgi:hypothetical protein